MKTVSKENHTPLFKVDDVKIETNASPIYFFSFQILRHGGPFSYEAVVQTGPVYA